MKQIKNFCVFSDGSCYFDYNVVTSVKFDHIIFQKLDYKNSSLHHKKKVKAMTFQHSKAYKKKFF